MTWSIRQLIRGERDTRIEKPLWGCFSHRRILSTQLILSPRFPNTFWDIHRDLTIPNDDHRLSHNTVKKSQNQHSCPSITWSQTKIQVSYKRTLNRSLGWCPNNSIQSLSNQEPSLVDLSKLTIVPLLPTLKCHSLPDFESDGDGSATAVSYIPFMGIVLQMTNNTWGSIVTPQIPT